MQRAIRRASRALALVVPWLLLAGPASGQRKQAQSAPAERGAMTYRVHCAVCHGTNAEGDGPLAERLRFAPPDLTRLAKQRVEILGTARIAGSLAGNSIAVAEGAIIAGEIKVTSGAAPTTFQEKRTA